MERSAKPIKTFLDLDDTLAAFSAKAEELGFSGYSPNASVMSRNLVSDLKLWLHVARHPEFWLSLDKTPLADEIFKAASNRSEGGVFILTALPNIAFPNESNLWREAAEAKTKWVSDRFDVPNERIIVTRARLKKTFVEPDFKCVLVDDKDGNLDSWSKVGGVSFKADPNLTELTLSSFFKNV